MMHSDVLIEHFISTVRGNAVGTFYLNGLPRTGKTFFLQTMKEQMDSNGVSTFGLGPYRIVGTDSRHLIDNILSDLRDAVYLERSIRPPKECDFTTFWEWAATQIKTRNQVFLVTVDVGNTGRLDPMIVASLFSNARKLESRILDSGLRVHTIFEGYWDTYLLDTYYKKIGISFPYTPTYNYAVWLGINQVQTIQMVAQKRIDTKPIIGKILHEITGGNPSVSLGILDKIGDRDLDYDNIVKATKEYAIDGGVTLEIVDIWMRLPPEAKKILKNIVLRRRILGLVPGELKQLLLCSGLTKEVYVQNQEYLSLRSWYVELAIMAHAVKLGISDPIISRIDLAELMPELTVINNEAYQIIYDIENQVRNFAVQQRYRSSSTTIESDILDVDIDIRRKKENVARETAKWKARSIRNGVMVDVNPRIAYSSTGQLCGLLERIALDLNSNEWLEIASSLDEMKDIRDAVMHNQIINDFHLERLYGLQASIYHALNQV